MKKLFDLVLGSLLCILLFLPFIIISALVKITSKGPVLYWSDRIGRDSVIFRMPKFRSMLVDAPEVATDLLDNPEAYLSPIGSFLRRSSLDEIPQLISVLKGDMSFVGPRPALFNQYELIKLRQDMSLDKLLPGITGWAQINGRDDLSILKKVELDKEYLKSQSFYLDLKILWKTLMKVINREGVSH